MMMGLKQAIKLGIALRERASDLLRPAVAGLADEKFVETKAIEVQSYDSVLPFDPELIRRWYKKLAQDVMDETGSPVLRTKFDYHGAVIANGRILSDGVTHVSVFNAKNQLQDDYTAHHRIKPIKLLKRKPVHRVAGTTLHLCAPLATLQGNYAHWLFDAMARWVLLEDLATNPVQIDQFLVPANKPACREAMLALGVLDEQIVELSIHEVMEFEHLVCMSRPRGYSSNVAPGWLVQGYRERLKHVMHEPETANKRLYISRRDAGSRKFREEDKLIDELEKRGFTTVELSKLGLREKAALFSQATDVVGLTGAGMTSVMFCPRGARVIELYPSNFVSYLFATVCAALDHEHHSYIFKNTSKRSLLSRHSGEFALDLEDFLSSLDLWQGRIQNHPE